MEDLMCYLIADYQDVVLNEAMESMEWYAVIMFRVRHYTHGSEPQLLGGSRYIYVFTEPSDGKIEQ